MATASVIEESKQVSKPKANFTCQKCSHPLKLDESFNAASKRTLTDLTVLLSSAANAVDSELNLVPSMVEGQLCEADEVSRKFIKLPSRVVSCESGNGFTLLGESEPSHLENLSHRLKVTSRLFDILSEQSEVDHPLCEECTDTLLDLLDQELMMTEDDCTEYREFMKRLASPDHDTDEAALDTELEQLRIEETKLQRQLESIESERAQLAERTAAEEAKSAQLDSEEDRYFNTYNEYKRQLIEYEDAQRSVDNQLKYATSQLDKLKTTNVFNATFHIWHNGHFGTINNFRLGRLPSVPVEWNEINAAWGQTVLLLHSLGNKMNLKFQRYRLVPYGNHSFLESLDERTKELPLYGSGGFRFVWDTKFDQAMAAFLDCLQQFKEEVEKGDTGFCLPYKMEKGRIEDSSTATSYSIKMQFNSEEQWTKALKFMLTNLKWGLAWVSSQFAHK